MREYDYHILIGWRAFGSDNEEYGSQGYEDSHTAITNYWATHAALAKRGIVLGHPRPEVRLLTANRHLEDFGKPI